jgi:beta-N-acetylhexosaminidase
MSPRRAAAVVCLAAIVLCSGCVGADRPVLSDANPPGTPPARDSPAGASPFVEAPSPPPSLVPPSCGERMFDRMTTAQRVGQLFLLGISPSGLGTTEARAIRSYHFGSVTLAGKTSAGVRAVRAVTDEVQALATPQATASVRFFTAANQEGGLVQPLQGPGFERMPAATYQGAVPPPALQHAAFRWGGDLRAAGLNLDLAPVADVVPRGADAANPPIGAVLRHFGHDPVAVGDHAAAFLRGMQQARVATMAKHFPGLGRVRSNTDFTPAVVDSITTGADPYLEAFRRIIDAGVPFVMISLVTYSRIDSGHLAVFSPIVMEQLLRQRMGFEGVIVSDTLGGSVAVRGLSAAYVAIRYLSSGGDMITSDAVGPAVAMARAIMVRAGANAEFRARVDDAVRRVLAAKDAYGLLPCSEG